MDIRAFRRGNLAIRVDGAWKGVDGETAGSVERGQVRGGEALVVRATDHDAVPRFPVDADLGLGGAAEITVALEAAGAGDFEGFDERDVVLGRDERDDRLEVSAGYGA